MIVGDLEKHNFVLMLLPPKQTIHVS